MFIRKIQRKKGIAYRAHVKKNGKHFTQIFERKYDAQQWAQETEARLEEGCRVDVLFKTLAEEWLQNHSKINNSASHYLSNHTKLRCVLPVLGHKYVHQISFKDMEVLVTHLQRQDPTRKPATINRYIRFVSTVMNYGIKRGDLLRNPVKKDHFLTQDEVAWQYWQFEEANKFLDYVEQKYRTKHQHVPLIYKIALNTGMRFGEILALKWDAVLLQGERSSITVRRTMCPRTREIKETTKGKRIRYVGVNEVLLKALQEAWKQKTSNFVVSNQVGGMLDERNFVQRHFEHDVKEAQVSRIRFHDLRHSYASLFMMAGGSLYDLQKILGHQDTKTTERYAHLSKDYLLDKANVVVVGRRENVVELDFQNKNLATRVQNGCTK